LPPNQQLDAAFAGHSCSAITHPRGREVVRSGLRRLVLGAERGTDAFER
jgi:hypothetical protein